MSPPRPTTPQPPSLPILESIPGRGTTLNPPNRFQTLHVEDDFDQIENQEDFLAHRNHPTQYLIDTSKSIIATNDSPDVGFTHSINPYRGCSHGCAYCYARPTHEWLGFSPGLDFETKIMVKLAAPDLLRKELTSPKYHPVCLSMSGVTDAYQPVENKLKLTRRCLEVLAGFHNPVGIITKNHLVTRDIDLLKVLAADHAAVVILSITTLDQDLTRRMEPRTSVPKRRLDAIRALTAAGIPAGVMIAPVIPGLTDHEMPAILQAAADAGATFAGFTPLRLPYAVAELFENWLAVHYPDRKDKILNRIRDLRGGKLNDSTFGTRMRGQGLWAEQLKSIFHLAQRTSGLTAPFPTLSTSAFRLPPSPQMTLW